ncbi:PP2C family protein-serine/threonine phosphatase [Nocardioides insulae]|uniref:PP2C family protein-serine/threonine phosphatase n=1 Tax=Nocardioides insulae TaxID=394734 RepID=UPI001FE14CB5|nr:protein phosphatase 2C domain-containing protein [Nocardioides insulae]
MRLRFAAISDVGRVRKDNQDAGYAGPWLLTVCDGVGGAARGDIASSTAVQQLRRLDDEPVADHTPDDLLGEVSGALVRAHDRIGELVDADPALDGTSTTAVVARFDGARIGIGHVGDSRAYLYRDGELTQLTHDHTFVQSLIDEGRITEEEARVHPHRNLILRALDGVRDVDPDLFVVELAQGDRLMLCSDGVCGSLEDHRLGDVLATGSADYAAVELVRAALEAGSSDNVTCVVADVVSDDDVDELTEVEDLEPLLVGAAAELRRRHPTGRRMFRGHRSGDTGELEPITADLAEDDVAPPPGAIPTDPDPEAYRYAPRPPHRFGWLSNVLGACVVIGVIWVIAAGAWSWSQQQFYVGEEEGTVTIFRGLDTEFAGIALSEPFETTDITLDELSEFDADKVRGGISAEDLDDAHASVDALAERVQPTGSSLGLTTDPGTDPSESEEPSASPSTPSSSGELNNEPSEDATP